MLRALEGFTCFPPGEGERTLSPGDEFEIADAAYADLLVSKGHAERVPSPAPAAPQPEGDE